MLTQETHSHREYGSGNEALAEHMFEYPANRLKRERLGTERHD